LVSVLETVWYDSAICRQGKKCKKTLGFPNQVERYGAKYENGVAYLLSYTPWDFYEWITCNEKPRCAPNIFPIMFWREI
jgi:hypothetical protein